MGAFRKGMEMSEGAEALVERAWSAAIRTRAGVFAAYAGCCFYCGHPADGLDHVIPRAADRVENLVPACTTCNSAKGRKSVEEYRLRVAERMGWVFSTAQRAYLAEIGCRLPPTPSVVFWGERHGV